MDLHQQARHTVGRSRRTKTMKPLLRAFWKDESGHDADYALFIALVAILLIAAFGPFRRILAARFEAAAAVLRFRR